MSLPLSECMKEVWKGDTGTRGGAESDGTTEEKEEEEEEGKMHDAGEL